MGYTFLAIWSWIFSMLTFIRYEFHGRENFRKGQAYIYVSNHTSFLDLPGLAMLIPGEFRPLAKKELLKIPVFGLIARGATVIVDRSSGVKAEKRSLDKLKKLWRKGFRFYFLQKVHKIEVKKSCNPSRMGHFVSLLILKCHCCPW